MSTTTCMIAGLPGSGKSTYIGALWYCLRHSVKDRRPKLIADNNNLPDDISVLNRLGDAYKAMKLINRTNSNENESVQINLIDVETEKSIQVEVPDFLGETFRDLVELKESELLNEWVDKAESLVYFISDVSVGEFEDDEGPEDDEAGAPAKDIPPFNITSISSAAMNIMVLKNLLAKKKFKKIVIVLSLWDKMTDNGTKPKNPEDYLEENSPALYHFIVSNIQNVSIIGLSAQGREYPKDDEEQYAAIKKEVRQQTNNGRRSFVEDGSEIIYDLSIPLYLLLKE